MSLQHARMRSLGDKIDEKTQENAKVKEDIIPKVKKKRGRKPKAVQPLEAKVEQKVNEEQKQDEK